MPSLQDIVEKREKKQFKKKSYRPWDLTGGENAAEEKVENISQDETPSNLIPLPSTDEVKPVKSTEKATNAVAFEEKVTPDNAPKKISESETQLDIAIDTKQVAIRDQSDNKKISVGEQTGNKQVTIRKQIDTRLDNNQITNPQDLGQFLDPYSLKNQVQKITGIQKKIMDTVVDVCTANNKLETGPLLTKGLADYVGTTVGTTKMSIKRLIDKDFLQRGIGRTARGGYINLRIRQEVFDLVLQARKEKGFSLNPVHVMQNKHQVQSHELDISIDNNSLYSSNNINTTTKNNKNLNIPEEWLSINFSPLEEIGFTQTQIKQLVDKNTPEIVQESIDFFAYDISQNPNKYKSPLNVIMGVLRKGNAWSKPVGYESPQEKALREYAERKKAEIEKREQLINDLVEAEFSDWQLNLMDKEIENIVPEEVRNSPLKAAKLSCLRNYFKEKVLIPRLKKEGMY